jgi:hypothetical protein
MMRLDAASMPTHFGQLKVLHLICGHAERLRGGPPRPSLAVNPSGVLRQRVRGPRNVGATFTAQTSVESRPPYANSAYTEHLVLRAAPQGAPASGSASPVHLGDRPQQQTGDAGTPSGRTAVPPERGPAEPPDWTVGQWSGGRTRKPQRDRPRSRTLHDAEIARS